MKSSVSIMINVVHSMMAKREWRILSLNRANEAMVLPFRRLTMHLVLIEESYGDGEELNACGNMNFIFGNIALIIISVISSNHGFLMVSVEIASVFQRWPAK